MPGTALMQVNERPRGLPIFPEKIAEDFEGESEGGLTGNPADAKLATDRARGCRQDHTAARFLLRSIRILRILRRW